MPGIDWAGPFSAGPIGKGMGPCGGGLAARGKSHVLRCGGSFVQACR